MNRMSGHETPSQVIRNTISNSKSRLTVEDLIKAFGSQSFNLMLIVMALPLTIPLPPGIGFIPAGLLCVWAFQRMLGRTHLWVPKAVGKLEISQALINKIEIKALPLCEKLEKRFLNNSLSVGLKQIEVSLASLVVVILSILIMIPTPFLNSIPAVLIILMELTILNSNRKLLWINMSLGLLALGFIGSTLYIGSEALIQEIGDHY